MFRTTKSSLLVLLVVIGAIAATQGPTQFHPGFNLFSRQQDIQLGQEAAGQIRKKVTMVHDPVLTSYVNAVGQRLASAQEARDSGFPFSFEVIADPTINAFALPGGPMFINTGLLKAVDNEAQLAGVMGHEMSHVILRHGTNQVSKAQFVQLGAALVGTGNNGSMLGQLAQVGVDFTASSLLLRFSRTAESQADLLGSHLMAESGYDPVEMAKFFDKLKGGHQTFQFLSDHPDPGGRQKAIEQEAALLPERPYGYQTGQFQQMKKVAVTIPEPKPKPVKQ